jgi:hypothetical protein
MFRSSILAFCVTFILAGCAHPGPAPDEPRARPAGQYQHPAEYPGNLDAVDPEAFPETPGFPDSGRPRTGTPPFDRR